MADAISDDSIRVALVQLGGRGSVSSLARHMGFSTRSKKGDALRQALQRLLEGHELTYAGGTYLLPTAQAPTLPRVDAGAPLPQELDRQVIACLVALKRARMYPAVPSEILQGIEAPKPGIRQFGPLLAEMAKQGILAASKRRRSTAYLLAGDDPRYAAKPDDKLKFELLAEIEALRAEALELTAHVTATKPAETPAVRGHDESIFAAIERLAKKTRRRTVQLWQLREALSAVPTAELDRALVRLGSTWKLELQPVQDSTKLSDQQKNALLTLPDGTAVVAVAMGSD